MEDGVQQTNTDSRLRAHMAELWKHPQVSAETFLKNLQTFLAVLLTSKSATVAQWKTENCKKAFAWANYFEQVLVAIS